MCTSPDICTLFSPDKIKQNAKNSFYRNIKLILVPVSQFKAGYIATCDYTHIEFVKELTTQIGRSASRNFVILT